MGFLSAFFLRMTPAESLLVDDVISSMILDDVSDPKPDDADLAAARRASETEDELDGDIRTAAVTAAVAEASFFAGKEGFPEAAASWAGTGSGAAFGVNFLEAAPAAAVAVAADVVLSAFLAVPVLLAGDASRGAAFFLEAAAADADVAEAEAEIEDDFTHTVAGPVESALARD